jgi:hypothetical protein
MPAMWKDDQVEYLLKNFNAIDQEELQNKLSDYSWNSIKGKASRLGLPAKGKLCRKDSAEVNHQFFETPNELNSYWAGFIAADGCITNGRMQISINKTDEMHLRKFVDAVEGVINITYGKDNTVRVSVASTQWVEDLQRVFNIGPRKSLTLEPPANLNKRNRLAFITGYIDGDGCWRHGAQSKSGNWKYLILEVVGTDSFLNWMNDNLVANASIRKVDTYHVLSASCMRAFEIHNQLWNPGLPLLDRKWGKPYKVWSPR